MDIRAAITGQYHASLAMLRQAIELCPDEVWLTGTHPRHFWRIAYHVLFYTHWYLEKESEDVVRWEKDREHCACLWEDEDGSLPPEMEPYSKAEVLQYLDQVDASVDAKVDAMDLDSPESGFYWYKIPKLDHQLMNIRHVQHHVGQLAELLMANGVEVDWIGRRAPKS